MNIPKIKTYEKQFAEELFDFRTKDFDTSIGSCYGDRGIGTLAAKFRELFKEYQESQWRFFVRYAWLEAHFMVNNRRRTGRAASNVWRDGFYNKFLRDRAGFSQKTLTMNKMHRFLESYFLDFYPDFLEHDPEKEPEYFAFPYKNVTFDHLLFVSRLGDERLALLDEAERKVMSFVKFANWAANWAFCSNQEMEKEKYVLRLGVSKLPYLEMGGDFIGKRDKWWGGKNKLPVRSYVPKLAVRRPNYARYDENNKRIEYFDA
jgi:hypothetical protein